MFTRYTEHRRQERKDEYSRLGEAGSKECLRSYNDQIQPFSSNSTPLTPFQAFTLLSLTRSPNHSRDSPPILVISRPSAFPSSTPTLTSILDPTKWLDNSLVPPVAHFPKYGMHRSCLVETVEDNCGCKERREDRPSN